MQHFLRADLRLLSSNSIFLSQDKRIDIHFIEMLQKIKGHANAAFLPMYQKIIMFGLILRKIQNSDAFLLVKLEK